MLLWLPLQGYAAVAMPLCKHATHGTQQAVSIASGHEHAGRGGVSNHAHHGTAAASEHGALAGTHHQGAAGLSCNDCGACHLACSPAAAPTQHDFAPADTERYSLSSPSVPQLFIPEQRKRPPLTRIV